MLTREAARFPAAGPGKDALAVLPGGDEELPAPLPGHVALICDGSGRWAEKTGRPRHAGHRAGQRAATEAVLALDGLGIAWLTLYAFSQENWKRPAGEVRSILGVIEQYLAGNMQLFDERNIRMRFIGRTEPLPSSLLAAMDAARVLTARNTGMTLTTAVSYGGRAEIVDAVRRMIADGVPAGEVTEERVREYLYEPAMPDPDLVIRTGGDQRTSNFMPWQIAYSEVVYLRDLFPELTAETVLRAVADYRHRDRRFGGLAQAGPAGGARLRCPAS